LIGSTFLRSKKLAMAAPESLLRKVERVSATPAVPVSPSPRLDETASSGVPPMPTPAKLPSAEASRPKVAEAFQPREVVPAAPERTQRQTEMLASSRRKSVAAPKRTADAVHDEDSALEFGQRLGGEATSGPSSKVPVRY